MTIDKVEQYLRKNEIDVQNANASFIVADWVYAAYVESEKVHGVAYTPLCCYFSGDSNNFYQLLDKTHVRNVAKKAYIDFLENPSSLEDKIAKHAQLEGEIDVLWQEYQSVQNISDERLRDVFEIFIAKSREWWFYGAYGEDKGAVITEEVAPNFEKRHGLSKADAQQIISTLSHPQEQSIMNLERKQFLELCLAVAEVPEATLSIRQQGGTDNEAIVKMAEEYIKNNFWIKTDFYDAKILTIETVLQDITKELESKSVAVIKEEIEKIEKSSDVIKRDQGALLSSLTLSDEDLADIRFAQRTAFWIDRRKLGMMKQIYYLIIFAKDIASRFGLNYREISFYSVNDIKNVFIQGKKRYSVFSEKGAFVVYETGKAPHFFYGEEGKRLLNMAKHVDAGDIVKGMVASKGKAESVEGVVRLVSDPQNDEFVDGEILVTSMTRVEFVPLMRRAKAIITNEGGIACHAAIVSRELGIPCVIGTKVATDRLKSGDKVKIDLKLGIVSLEE